MGGSDRALMLALPPMAVLAAFTLPTLQRASAAAIDWFSVFFFSACALVIDQELETRKKERASLEAKLNALDQRVRWLSHSESSAAVDSELALLWHTGFDLRRWQLNLLY